MHICCCKTCFKCHRFYLGLCYFKSVDGKKSNNFSISTYVQFKEILLKSCTANISQDCQKISVESLFLLQMQFTPG